MASKSNKQSTGKTGTGSAAPAPSLAATVDASSPRGGERTRNKEGKSTNSNPPRSSTAPAFAGSSRIPKPSKEDLEQLSNEIQTQINVLQNESKDIKKQIDKLLDARNGSKNEFETAKSALQLLINERKQLLDEKTTLSTARDTARDKINSRINEEKSARSELKFSNLESIESQIRELEARQARTTMPLQEEKKLLKEIHQLEMSKRTISTLTEMRNGIEILKQQKLEIDRQFNEKSAQVKGISDRISAQRDVLEEINKGNIFQKEIIPSLRVRLTEIKREMDRKYQEIKTMRQEFKEKEEAYYVALAEERQRKKEQKQMEIEAKKIADEARRKAEEEEELKRIPYEDEMNMCDYLVSYLETLLPAPTQGTLPTDVTPSASSTAPSTGFDGMKVLVRADEEFSTVATQKKKSKKKAGNSQREVISHGVDTLDSFSLLDISPPNTLANVPTAIDALKAKKVSYQGLERGAVETVATKLKNEREKKTAEEAKKRPKASSGFSLERDFPDLAIAAAAAQGVE